MQFIQGKNRNQSILFPENLDQIVEQDNEVRIIDLFVESINLSDFKFTIKTTVEGRPAYHPKDLLKLFVYGYLNQIRSSRVLEKECKRNIEVIWLLKELVPDHNTISNFRRDNEKAIRKVFRYTVSIANQFNLIGGKLIAGDSTKLRAQNSKKNNFNPKKIERHLAYIDNKLDEYNHALEAADDQNKIIINQEIDKQNERKVFYNDLSKQLEETGETQISLSDPESRQMITRNNITEVAYNVQTTVDAKHNLVIDYKVTNQNDSKAMGGMLRRAKTILNTTDFTALYDKGYHTGSEMKAGIEMNIDIMVAIPDVASNAPDKTYNVAHFIYNAELDYYTCPQEQILNTNGRWYNKDRGKSIVQIKQYKTKACLTCSAFALCTKNKEGRQIERSEHQAYIDQNRLNIAANPKVYKRRQAIVEHPYGIVKRQWGFYYITTKRSMKRASADVGLMFVAFNVRRLMNIIDKKAFKKFLQELAFFDSEILTTSKAIKAQIRYLFLSNTNSILLNQAA
jgi:transposase